MENNQKELQWIVITIRQAQEINVLVGRQVGAQALLTLDDIIGESYPIQQVRRMARLAAAARAPILLLGESGVGKNAVARAIHNESPWRDGPFLVFACSSVPSELLLRELLGYDEIEGGKKLGGRPSKFELAQNGILYFQDVEYLPLEAHVTLLNVLELAVVHRQGSLRPVPVDVRIIASSTARLDQLAAQGSFRTDLLYRLGSIQIKLPPLRERTRDIPLLAERILNRIARQLDRPLHLASQSQDLLRRYAWPGNVRELEAALSQAAAQAGPDGRIDTSQLPEFVRAPALFHSAGTAPVRAPSLLEMERQALLQTAHLCGGNVTQMARVLGLGRTTVWRKLKEFDISIDSYRVSPEVELLP